MTLALCHVFWAVFCVYCHVVGHLTGETPPGTKGWGVGLVGRRQPFGRVRSTRVGGWVLSDWLSQTLPKYPTRWLTNLRRLTPRCGVHPTDLISLLTRLKHVAPINRRARLTH